MEGDETHRTSKTNRVIPPPGGYQALRSFHKARIIFDGTVRFCQRFVDLRSRTYDQMVQAARSGKQNILEGSQASGTSKETEALFVRKLGAEDRSYESYSSYIESRPPEVVANILICLRHFGARRCSL